MLPLIYLSCRIHPSRSSSSAPRFFFPLRAVISRADDFFFLYAAPPFSRSAPRSRNQSALGTVPSVKCRCSGRQSASLYKRRVSISLRSGERFVREVDSVDSILRGTGVSLLLSRGPLSSSLSSTWGNDTRAGPPRDSYETILSFSLFLVQRASHAALINLVRLFRDGRKKK